MRQCSMLLLAAGIAAPAAAETLVVPRPVPYAEDSDIASNIRNECKLGDKLAHFIGEFARARGDAVSFAPQVDEATPGRVLQVEIRDALSMGNAWTGHRKSVSVRGRLFADGEVVGTFKGRRDSMGGMFGGYKGSCSVLGRTVKALGQDIATWLQSPAMGAELGDLK
jgi:hypothetical protein